MPVRRRGLACRRAIELMTDYLEGALSANDRARLERHLAACPHCREYLVQITAIVEAAGHVEPDDLADETRRDLLALYRRSRVG